MSKDLAIQNEAPVPVEYDALDAVIGNDLDGEPLRFKDGRFLEGFDKNEVIEGTVLRVEPTSVQDGFVKYEDRKPVDWRMREWISGAPPIDRNALGDLDDGDWPDGKDPWAPTMFLAMKDAEGKLFKFSTHSVGGANSVRRLLREWRRQRDRHLGLVPVIALGADSYVHRVHSNTVHVPTFAIVGWEPWDDDASPLIEVTGDDPRTLVQDDLEDEIPF